MEKNKFLDVIGVRLSASPLGTVGSPNDASLFLYSCSNVESFVEKVLPKKVNPVVFLCVCRVAINGCTCMCHESTMN